MANVAGTPTKLSKFDIKISSTLLTDLRIELFNHDFSQVEVYNPAVQVNGTPNYHPMGIGINSPIVIADPSTPNGYFLSFLIGGKDAFVNAVNPVPPAGWNSQAYVYFDENGALVYTPGYVAGALDPGTVTVQSNQTNYRHIFRVMGKARIMVNTIRVKVGANFLNQLNESFVLTQNNIVNDAAQSSFAPDTFQNENNQQTTIVTVPVNTELNPKKGFFYNVIAGGALNTPNVVQMSVFFTPLTVGMLDMI